MTMALLVQLIALALVVLGVAMVFPAGYAFIVGGGFLLWVGKRLGDETS